MSKGLEKEFNEWDSILKKRFESGQISDEKYEEYKCRSEELKKSNAKIGGYIKYEQRKNDI